MLKFRLSILIIVTGLLVFAQTNPKVNLSNGPIMVPSNLRLFGGDTLDGFNVEEAMQKVNQLTANYGLNARERDIYFLRLEKLFVFEKYKFNTPIDTVIDFKSTLGVTCNNINFETGDTTGWTGAIGYNTNSSKALTVKAPGIMNHTATGTTGKVGLDLNPTTSCGYFSFENSAAAVDPFGLFPSLDNLQPTNTYSFRLGGSKININGGCTGAGGGGGSAGEMIQQTFAVTAANCLFSYDYAVVLEQPDASSPHTALQTPYFKVEVLDSLGDSIPCLQYYRNSTIASDFKHSTKLSSQGDSVIYLPWTSSSVNLQKYIGHKITIRFSAAGCTLGGHFGYAYVDGNCGALQLISTKPPTCADTNITLQAPKGGIAYQWTKIPAGKGIIGTSAADTVVVDQSGKYQVIVTTHGGCTYTLDTTISFVHTPITLTVTPTNVDSCKGSNTGSVLANPTSGTAPYKYSWTGGAAAGQTNATASGLGVGTYTVTVTSSQGCTGTATATLSGSTMVRLSGTNTNDICFGGSTATATVSAVGGSGAPYTYNWSGSNAIGGGGTTGTATGLLAGTYTVTVQDGSGCSVTNAYTITQPTALSLTPSTVNSTCGNSNGSASVSVTGGTTNYSYSWSNGATAQTATGLKANTYTISVTDKNGCTSTSTTIVNNTAGPTIALGLPTDPSCYLGNNGSVTATATGGTSNYTYSWSNGVSATTSALTSSDNSLVAGTYSVSVTDANGCVASSSVTLSQPTVVIINAPVTTPTSCTSNTGSAIVAGSGGTSPWNYSWSNGAVGQTAATLGVGTYSVTITDSKGCTAATTASINVLSGPSASTSPVNVKCFGNATGSASVAVTGGTPAYTYAWSNGGTAQTNTALVAGNYSVTVTDVAGCSVVSNVAITQPPVLGVSGTGLATSCFGGADGQAVVIPSGGTLTNYSAAWSNGGVGLSIKNLVMGSYSVTITDGNGCTKDTVLSVTQPTAVTATAVSTPANCNQLNGAASASASGGTVGVGGYTYSWSNAAVGQTASAIGAGVYTVTVTDKNSCSSTSTTTVNNLNGVIATMGTVVQNTCANSCTASAAVVATNGTTPYTYSWSNGNNAVTAAGLCKGDYTVTVTDSKSCSSTSTVTITSPTPLVLPAITQTKLCIGQQTYLVPKPTGATPAYTFSWTPGNSNADSLPVTATISTTYTLSVVDANNCPAVTTTIVVPVYPALNITASPAVNGCPNTASVLTSLATGGNGTYSYTWRTNPVVNNSSLSIKINATQVYTVVVHDGCTTPADSATVNVTLNPLPVVSFSGDSLAGCPTLCTNFTDKGTIASGTITKWSWHFDAADSSTAQNPRHCFPIPGKYTIGLKETSDKGCVAMDSIVQYIDAYPKPTAAFTYAPTTVTSNTPMVNFIDESTGASVWNWSIPDTSPLLPVIKSNLKDPSKSYYGAQGVFCTLLKVKNTGGCTDTITHCVTITPEFSLFIPDAFSPNGDNVNDLFYPKGSGFNLDTYTMSIYDRWGKVMYTTNDIEKGWDGTLSGKQCPQDVYTYLITIKDVYQKTHSFNGHVTLIR